MGYDFMSSRTTCSTYNLMTCCDIARCKVLKYICDLYRLKYDRRSHRNSPAYELRDAHITAAACIIFSAIRKPSKI